MSLVIPAQITSIELVAGSSVRIRLTSQHEDANDLHETISVTGPLQLVNGFTVGDIVKITVDKA